MWEWGIIFSLWGFFYVHVHVCGCFYVVNIACCVATCTCCTCSLLYVHVASPSAELVKRVRELYTRNSSDVRFLIPVLHGLQKVRSLSHTKGLVCHLPLLKNLAPTARVIVGRKEAYCWSLDRYKESMFCLLSLQQEVISALPKFIKLSPSLVKGVFDRLLVSYKGMCTLNLWSNYILGIEQWTKTSL